MSLPACPSSRLWLLCLLLLCLPAHGQTPLIRDGARQILPLDGTWEMLPNQSLQFQYPPPESGWKKEAVPGRSEGLSGDRTPYMMPFNSYLTPDRKALDLSKPNAAWLRRSFELPALPRGRRVRLEFEGVAFRSEVWINGHSLGTSLQGLVPRVEDITDYVREGKNELVVGVTTRLGIIDLANRTFIAPTTGVQPGIWGKTRVEIIPEVHLEKVFIQPSVEKKRISFDVVVTNRSAQKQKATLRIGITNARFEAQTGLKGDPVTLEPGETRRVTLSRDWIAPELWSPTNPALYYARVALARDGQPDDETMIRFGFREFEIRGHDFYLNGERIQLLRNSTLWSLNATRKDFYRDFRDFAGRPYNCIRLHLGFNSRELLELCDEFGVLAIPESGWHNIGDRFNLDTPELFVPQVEAYTRAMMELYYNHPSVVIWNLTNESFWGNTDEKRMAIADRLVKAAREVDPYRPLDADAGVSWGGRLPILSIHYPESSIGNSLREKYPDAAALFPNDWYWLRKDGENSSWRAEFKWDRPLIIGEYGALDQVESRSAYMGDAIFDWERWRYQRLDGRGNEPVDGNDAMWVHRGQADAYRLQGVAGINPWAVDGMKVMPPIAIRPVDFHLSFFGGEPATRSFVVFNDSGSRFAQTRVQARLHVGERTLWSQTTSIPMKPGHPDRLTLTIPVPAVETPTPAVLTLRLLHERGNHFLALDRYEETVYLMPRPAITAEAGRFRLLDRGEKTAAALAALGLKLTPQADPGDLSGVKAVIVGEGMDASAHAETLTAFVREGGVVIVLQPGAWTPLTAELPEADPQHAATRTWLRSHGHPLTRHLAEPQLSFWRPDHLVSRRTFRKPATGAFRSVIDSGGRYGMAWSPLLELPLGKGAYLLSSLDLASKAAVEPAAAQLLANLAAYAAAYQPAPAAPLRLLSKGNTPLKAALKAAGVISSEGLKGNGPILLDATYPPSKAELAAIREAVLAGGNLWLHGFDAGSLEKVAALLPFKPEMKPYDPSVQAATLRSRHPWLDSLASYDFFWTKLNLGARGDIFNQAQATARLGGEVLQAPTVQAVEPLLEPALLQRIPVGKGAILFDTLAWPEALGAENQKVTRIAASLAANLGAEVRTAAESVRFRYSGVSLLEQANMGYYDSVADDGKGGWTDQGPNDMRFFLINQIGRGGGLETGMEIEAEPFPEKVILGKRPFWLLDARKTGGKAVISLRGGDHGHQLPSEAKGIRVDRKADRLWFLQGAGWTPPKAHQVVARYVIHYEDGSQTEFPIRYGIEISEWWNPSPVAGAVVAWTGHNLQQAPIGIYATEWVNPHPDRKIASIDLIGNLSPTQIVLVGITAGEIEGGSASRPVARWNLARYEGRRVVSDLPGIGALVAGQPAPVPSSDQQGLQFADGASLRIQSSAIAGVFTAPFALKVALAAAAPPSGHYGGIVQAGEYGKSGFRLMLDRNLRVQVEMFRDGVEGLSSNHPLQPGRMHDLELRFDGHYASLLIDGRTDSMKEFPLPPPFKGSVQIGVASGKDYFFNGTISRIALDALPSQP